MKTIKRITAVVIIILSMLFAVGCNEVQQAEKTVNSALSALQKMELEESEKYYLEDSESSEETDIQDIEDIEMMKNMFKKLEYTIKSSEKVDSKTVNVVVEITTVDMSTVLSDYLQKAMQWAFSNALADPQPTEEETEKKMTELFNECLAAEDLKTVTQEITIKVVKDGTAWKLDADENFVNAATGNLMEAAEKLSENLGGAQE